MYDFHELRLNWGWIFTFGCISVLAGMIAITYSVIATLVSVILLGWLLILGGESRAWRDRPDDAARGLLHRRGSLSRIVGALTLHLPHRGWLLASGIINLALGIIVWGGWPVPALWVLGTLIGINMISCGWARIMLALALKSHRLEPITI